MTEPLTDEDLADYAELKMLLGKLPAAPWRVAMSLPSRGIRSAAGWEVVQASYGDQPAVLEFIALARNQMPELLAEVQRLRASARRECTALCGDIERDRDQLNAKLAAVRDFAEGMRGYCSPHGVSVHYADQLTAVLDATPAAVLPVLPKDDRGATRPVLAVACPTCQAKPGMACANRAAEHSHIKRRLAHSGAIITDPTPTVALTDADMADMGLDPETGLHVRPTPGAAPVVAEEAPAEPFEHACHVCRRKPGEHCESATGGVRSKPHWGRGVIAPYVAPAIGPAATDGQVA